MLPDKHKLLDNYDLSLLMAGERVLDLICRLIINYNEVGNPQEVQINISSNVRIEW